MLALALALALCIHCAAFMSEVGADLDDPQVQRELGICDRKYRNKSGTMYRSATAFCRAQAAQRYSREALKAAGAK